ncbi:MAG TPA: hypothetical protein VFC16_09765 [Nakamurella sp.]|nr:hypothetical protein [Nakamurella sp.]
MTKTTVTVDDLLGVATPTGDQLDAIAAAAVGHPAVVTRWNAEPVPYESGSPATGTLARLSGVTADGQPWSVFLKVLQHPRHWRLLDRVPEQLRADFLGNFPWRAELTAWDPTFSAHLPSGLRVPELYRVVELPEDRVAVWMEDIAVSAQPWTPDRFVTAAGVLGALAANRRDPELLAACPVPPGYGLRRYYDGAVRPVLPWLQSHDLWRHPLLATSGGTTLRADLLELAAAAPAILDRLDELPQALPHGDASPQNLLVPSSAPGTLVAIDVAFQCPLAVGFDLAQLLVGLVHAGQMPTADLPAIHRLLAPAYQAGMNQGKRPAALAEIEDGYIGSLVIRAAFTSLPFREPIPSLTDTYIDQRMMLTRFITDLGLQMARS